jgi:hypothetical protein
VSAHRNGIPTLSEAVDYTPAQLFEPDWRTRGRCAELPIDESDRMFYSERGQSSRAAKGLCA